MDDNSKFQVNLIKKHLWNASSLSCPPPFPGMLLPIENCNLVYEIVWTCCEFTWWFITTSKVLRVLKIARAFRRVQVLLRPSRYSGALRTKHFSLAFNWFKIYLPFILPFLPYVQPYLCSFRNILVFGIFFTILETILVWQSKLSERHFDFARCFHDNFHYTH